MPADALARDIVTDLLRHRGRTVATLAGFAIGVAVTIFLATLFASIRGAVDQQFSGLGAKTILLLPDQSASGSRGPARIAPEQERAIESAASQFGSFSTLYSLSPAAIGGVYRGARKSDCAVTVAGSDYGRIANLSLDQGRLFSPADDEAGGRRAFLGPRAVEQLGLSGQAIGATILIGGHSFKVIGTSAPRGQSFGVDQDCMVLLSWRTAETLWDQGQGAKTWIVRVRDGIDPGEAARDLQEVLKRNSLWSETGPLPLRVVSSETLLDSVKGVVAMLTLAGLGIAGVSILVSAIGVVNTMVLLVKERTREIGLAKALGATRSDIVTRYLLEASIIAGAGAVLGIALGYGAGAAACATLPGLEVPSAPLLWIILSAGSTILVGFAAGVLPAIKAADLQVIEALRVE